MTQHVPHIGNYVIPRRSPCLYAIRKSVRTHVPTTGKYVIGLSGGSDSLALAAACAAEGIDAVCVVVDHQLQDNSDKVAFRAAEKARSMGLKTVVEKVTVTPTGRGMEADARDARYECLFSYGKPLLIGHTKNDQAETVLMGMSRCASPRGVMGMAIVSELNQGTIIRPMLDSCTKSDTRRACDELGIPYWDDPQNEDVSFTRVDVRRSLIPVMGDVLGEHIVDRLCSISHQVRAEHDYFTTEMSKMLCDDGVSFMVDDVSSLDSHARSTVIAMMLKNAGVGQMKKAHVDSIDTLVTRWNGQKRIDVGGGARVVRHNGRVMCVTQ